MPADTTPTARRWLKAMGAFALLFGALTLVSGGRVLLDAEAARAAAPVVPFVVWFNVVAALGYLAAGVGFWRARPWAAPLALAIAAATALVFVGFGAHVAAGGAYAGRTVGALTFRTATWVVLALAARRLLPAR